MNVQAMSGGQKADSVQGLPIAIAMGDPAGIGPEIIAKAWAARASAGLQPFFVVGNVDAIAQVTKVPVLAIDSPDRAASAFVDALPVLQSGEAFSGRPGVPDVSGARLALNALEIAVGLARSGAASALVTAPVSKALLYKIGFTYPGQTEFVAERCGIARENAVMLLAGPDLRVVPMTTHIALTEVASRLSIDMIVSNGRITARGLQRNFGIARPRLAFAGFNPHAGEQGAMGREEIDIIAPAVARLQADGIDAVGPLPADTMFHGRARERYDVALCCYHDQALIPIKTINFDDGVNMTLGLPIVRTSPDHGTAFDIAGQDVAEPGAMIAAIRLAASAAAHRADYRLATAE